MKIFITCLLIVLLSTVAFNQENKIIDPNLIPAGLIKYLPDSLKEKIPELVIHATQNNLTHEYLWSFLPDSIRKFLPDSIHLFYPTPEEIRRDSLMADSISKISKIYDEAMKKRLFTSTDLMSLMRISELNLSPDGNWVLFTMKSPSILGNKFYTDIYAVNTNKDTLIQVTTHAKADYNPIWSPDGKTIAYLSTSSLTAQVFLKQFPNGEPKQLTKVEGGVSNIGWSPDGKYISFSADVKLDESIQDKYTAHKNANIRVYDKLPIRHWSEWTDEFYSHVFYVPVEGGEPIDIMPNEKFESPLKPFGGAEQIAWSSDSKEIAYVSKKIQNYVQSTNSDIYIYNLETKKTRNVTEQNKGFDLDPKFSPNGKYMAYISLEHDGFESDKRRLMIRNLSNGKVNEITSDFDFWVNEYLWHPDSKTIIYTADHKGTVKIFRIAVENTTVNGKNLKEKEFITLADGWFDYGHGLGISNDGNSIIFGRESMTEPMEIFQMNLNGGEQKRLTYLSEPIMKDISLPKVEEKWVTCKDGASMLCWVVYPPKFDETKKYPLITYCQGGPQSMISQRFHFRWNNLLMSSHGYVMIFPNRRGVPGFGQKWNDAISQDWGGKPMQDIMSATDIMLKQPFIDKDGSAAMGASAGGYAVFWLAGNHQGRYKAFASHCGVFNLTSMYGSTEELWFTNWENGGPYWEDKNKDYYVKHSPHTYADKWNTPIFISTGENDFRVPYTQSLEAFTVAKVKGLDAKLVVLPEETHFISKPQEFIIWDSELFEFLDKHCKHF
jgi:dipeptidyl aminopeptidase/acylaminoacyl peptidase